MGDVGRPPSEAAWTSSFWPRTLAAIGGVSVVAYCCTLLCLTAVALILGSRQCEGGIFVYLCLHLHPLSSRLTPATGRALLTAGQLVPPMLLQSFNFTEGL